MSNNTTQQITVAPWPALDSQTQQTDIFLIAIGVVGVILNTFVFTALMYDKRDRKSTTNVLIANESAIELAGCVTILILYPERLLNIYLAGSWGLNMCVWIDSGMILNVWARAPTTAIVVITLERFVKIVFPIWHRIHWRKWTLYGAVLVPWVYSFAVTLPFAIPTTGISGGHCRILAYWSSETFRIWYTILAFVVNYTVPLIVFLLCYLKILWIVRGSSKIGHKAHNSVDQSTTSDKDKNTNSALDSRQRNIIMMMFTLVGFYVTCWTPRQIYNLCYGVIQFDVIRYRLLSNITAVIASLHFCVNPIICLTMHRPTRKVTLQWFNLFKKKVGWKVSSGASSRPEDMSDQAVSEDKNRSIVA